MCNPEWHRKLGHKSVRNLKKVPNLCDDIPKNLKKCADDTKGVICIQAKHVRNLFNIERRRTARPLEILHSDVCGKISPPTLDEKNYFHTIIDVYTHFVIVYLMESKDETEVCIQEFINDAEVSMLRWITEEN